MSSLLERVREALASEYAVEREIASGGMGVVFFAHDAALRRPVAIKVMRPELATVRAAGRFVREAQIAANLRHPNIVPVHRAGEAAGIFYYVMDFIDGDTLADRLGTGPLARGDTVKLGRDLLDGLEAAHRAGVVHRDIKPANIFLLPGRALLADFGIAKPGDATSDVETETGAVVGTPAYMAPEQAAGGDVTPRSDLYAVGAVLVEAVSGRWWRAKAKPERADWKGVPQSLVAVLERALAWSPEDRWADARAFRRALWRTRTRRYVHRTVALTAGGVVAGASLAFIMLQPRAPPPLAPTVSVAVEPLELRGASSIPALPDTIGAWLVRNLSGYPDFVVRGAPAPLPSSGSSEIVLSGVVHSADDLVSVELWEKPRPGGVGAVVADVAVPRESWALLADSLAYYVLLRIWSEASPLAAHAAAVTQAVVSDPQVASFPDVAAGPRLLPSFDAPRGAVGLGSVFARMTQRPDLERSGLVAELLGFLALGHLDSARGRADRLRARFPEQDELALTTAAIEGAYSLADRAAGRTRSAARAVLDRHSTRQGGPAHLRRRAAWMLGLLSLQEGSPAAAERYEGLLADEPAPAPLGAFLRANKMAAGGDQLGAIRASAWLVALDSAGRAGDPMFRALLHLSRAT